MSKKAKVSARVRAAENILRGQAATPHEIFDLAKALKDEEQEFGYARRLLARARLDPAVNDDAVFRTLLRQQHAVCTYKDPDLPDGAKFDRAIEILAGCEDLKSTTDQETLGIAGAIYKYKWQAFGQRQDIETSLQYYLRGYLEGMDDFGYTAINAAFVLNLISAEEETLQLGVATQDLCGRAEKATQIRKEIVAFCEQLAITQPSLKGKWWFVVTLAEAYFGLEQYDEADIWLQIAGKLPDFAEWEFESTARQLATLARLSMRRGGKKLDLPTLMASPAWAVLKRFLGDNSSGVFTVFFGKVGLALSGGGFRASFFHIGVLAKLAELDVLRHVEVLSCVSGGSIVGAHYYLKIRKLLQSTSETDIDRDTYIKIVQELEVEFFSGVEKNIRTRVLGSFRANLKMAFLSDYSRTERVGELYEKHLFSQVEPERKKLWINDLVIDPIDGGPNFKPKYHNWRRDAKVPILVLNATTLNTGHNWQFTASWMGEPPAGADAEVDANYRLRRMYYSEAPQDYQNIRLGNAVAASASVPGVFDPLSFPNLYPGITLRLVDGGVHDNQGTSALLDQACNVLLVSDASGQMGDQNEPGDNIVSVLLRSNSILQSRIRVSEYEDVKARRQSSLIKGLMFVHLKKDLDAVSKDWKDCEDPTDASDDTRLPFQNGVLTPYGIRKDIQKKLSAIRTDLDSFNEAEAFALMVSGYRMTEQQFSESLPDFPKHVGSVNWRFLAIEPVLKRIGGNEKAFRKLESLLDAARAGAFKIWQLEPVLKVSGWVLMAAILAGLFAVCFIRRSEAVITYGWAGIAVLSALTSLVLAKVLGPKVTHFVTSFGTEKRIETELWRVVIFVAVAFAGFGAAWIHILIFDRWYKWKGRLQQVIGEPPAPVKRGTP